jgi:hypothetical protein
MRYQEKGFVWFYRAQSLMFVLPHVVVGVKYVDFFRITFVHLGHETIFLHRVRVAIQISSS